MQLRRTSLHTRACDAKTEGQIPQMDFFSHALNIYGIPPLLGSLASQTRAIGARRSCVKKYCTPLLHNILLNLKFTPKA